MVAPQLFAENRDGAGGHRGDQHGQGSGAATAKGVPRSADHQLSNEQQVGPKNTVNDGLNPDSVWAPETDNGTMLPFKYSFDLSHKEIDSGGWTRQVTVRDLPISKKMAGVEMRLTAGGIRELHWHVSSEWAYMIYGNARITAVDEKGMSFVKDVKAGDLWLFPGGIPHSIQGLGPDGCKFLLVFDQGDFDEFSTFLLGDWFKHTPKEVLAKNFSVTCTPAKAFYRRSPKRRQWLCRDSVCDKCRSERKRIAVEHTRKRRLSTAFVCCGRDVASKHGWVRRPAPAWRPLQE